MDDMVPPPVIMPRPIDQGPIPVVSDNDIKRQLWLSYNQGYNEGFTRGYNTAMKKCSNKPAPQAPISSKYAARGRGDFIPKSKKPHYNHFAHKPKKTNTHLHVPDTRDVEEYPPLNVVFNKSAVNVPPNFQQTMWTKPSESDAKQQW